MTTIPETVAAVLDHDAKATPGPWNGATDETGDGFVDQVKTGEGVFIGMALHAAPSELGVGNGFGSPEWADNASLVAYYRTAAPALAREVERLEKVADNLQREFRDAEQLVCDERELLLVMKADRDTARAECERLRAGLLEAEAERDAATARAERAERELAVIKAACPTSTVLTEHCRCGSGAHPRECKRHPFAYETHVASMDAEAREVAVAVTTERARLVEAIAAYVVHIAGRETANAMALGDGTWRVIASVCGDLADHIRSHNWAPPEEDGHE